MAGGDSPLNTVIVAPAKLNLVLDVGPLRADGYHEVTTVLVAISLFDRLRLGPGMGIELWCDDAGVPAGPANLAWRAADLLATTVGGTDGVRIEITKAIPPASGLGGGSADAAAALVGCARIWGVRDRADLETLGAQLGADVPFFVRGGLALGRGRGDRITALPPPPALEVLLTRPARGSSTAAAYQALDASGSWERFDAEGAARQLAQMDGQGPARWRAVLAELAGNSFEGVLFRTRPDMARLRAVLLSRGASVVGVAGSGSALWALGEDGWAPEMAAWLGQWGLWAHAAHLHNQGVALGEVGWR